MLLINYSAFHPVNIEEALAYQMRRRNIPPRLYNPRRLTEKQVNPREGQCVSTLFQPKFYSGNENKSPQSVSLHIVSIS